MGIAVLVDAHLPWLAEEVRAMAAGSGIDEAAAWILQLRAELLAVPEPECSALAVRDGSGEVLLAQNVDLPEGYRDLMVLMERRDDARPAILSLAPAGQMSQSGMNQYGVTVLATSVHAPGRPVGVPRYHLTRVALAKSTRTAAVAAVSVLPRAGSRNLMVADTHGACCVETIPAQTTEIPMAGGPLLHTNHFLGPLKEHENAPESLLENSRTRLRRLRQLTADGPHTVEGLMDVLSDRSGTPHALRHRVEDDDDDWATVATVIAKPASRTMWVSTDRSDTAQFLEVSLP